jgi:hypothetical protein
MSSFQSLSRSSAGKPIGVVIVDADPAQRRALAGMIAERTNGRFVAAAYGSSEEATASSSQTSKRSADPAVCRASAPCSVR